MRCRAGRVAGRSGRSAPAPPTAGIILVESIHIRMSLVRLVGEKAIAQAAGMPTMSAEDGRADREDHRVHERLEVVALALDLAVALERAGRDQVEARDRLRLGLEAR